MTTTPYELLSYYSNLLILQYVGKPRANATIQALAGMATMPQTPSVYTLVFSSVATGGAFTLSFNGSTSAAILWNDNAATIQTTLRALPGLSVITVAGQVTDAVIVVTMTGVTAPSPPFTVVTNALENDTAPADPLVTEDGDFIVTEDGDRIATGAQTVDIRVMVSETDNVLPLAIMNGFNLTGLNTATGVQLDVLGKYAGVTRTAFGFFGQVTLDDADFLQFIKIAIVRNNSGSSLADIQQLLFDFFPGQILVYDYQNMQMDYVIDVDVGSEQLIQLFITEGLLPKPMGVQLGAVIYIPNITNVFGFRTYALPAFNTSPFNIYADYQTVWPWLSYANALILP